MSSWVPLEADPELFNTYSQSLGLDTTQFSFFDVYGLDEELLAFVPAPVEAVLFLFPITERTEAQRLSETAADAPDDVLWFPQTIGNACGTIGLLHAVANSRARTAVGSDAALQALLAEARRVPAAERPALLEHSAALRDAHAAVAVQGQTAAPDATDEVNLHFVAFVRSSRGRLLELDGRRRGPVEHAIDVPAGQLLASVAQFVRDQYIAQDPEHVQFNLMALSASP